MGEEFRLWVTKEYQSRGWTMNELARRSNLSSGFVSAILSGKKEPGAKFYQGIARAFALPLESIERLDREGVIPLASSPDHTLNDLAALAADLPQEARHELLLFAHYLSWKISHNLPL